MTESDGYLLGRAPAELDRLRLQAEIYAPHTEHLLALAGIAPGMRVLDIGCGAGDVTMIAARLVGPTGSVLGVDMNADVLDVARARAADAGLGNVSFQHATLPDVQLDGPVDALIGRLILVHLADPVEVVRKLSALVRPGGVVTFQETSSWNARSEPETPLVTQAYRWVADTLRAHGRKRPLGLHRILRAAGFDRVGAVMEIPAGDTKFQIPYFVSGTINSLLPAIEAAGVATRAEIDIDTLADRIIAELDEAEALLWPPELTGVWARVPESLSDR
ncbi:MAG TPA: class I SAM-dependent methyltransferase [Pseudonocardiaceae bacterium]